MFNEIRRKHVNDVMYKSNIRWLKADFDSNDSMLTSRTNKIQVDLISYDSSNE